VRLRRPYRLNGLRAVEADSSRADGLATTPPPPRMSKKKFEWSIARKETAEQTPTILAARHTCPGVRSFETCTQSRRFGPGHPSSRFR